MLVYQTAVKLISRVHFPHISQVPSVCQPEDLAVLGSEETSYAWPLLQSGLAVLPTPRHPLPLPLPSPLLVALLCIVCVPTGLQPPEEQGPKCLVLHHSAQQALRFVGPRKYLLNQ